MLVFFFSSIPYGYSLILTHAVVGEDRRITCHLLMMVQDGGGGDLPMTLFFILHLSVT